MSADRMPTGRGIAQLATVPDSERRDGGPELVIQGEHPVVAMPVLPRRRDQIRETICYIRHGSPLVLDKNL